MKTQIPNYGKKVQRWRPKSDFYITSPIHHHYKRDWFNLYPKDFNTSKTLEKNERRKNVVLPIIPNVMKLGGDIKEKKRKRKIVNSLLAQRAILREEESTHTKKTMKKKK